MNGETLLATLRYSHTVGYYSGVKKKEYCYVQQCGKSENILLSRKKPYTKDSLLRDSVYMKFKNRQDYSDRNKHSGCLVGAGGRKGVWLT